jgi:hypothetical protein
MAPNLARHRFAPDPRAPGGARRFARATLEGWRLDHLAETVELLVSEVVTNAVGHARTGGEMVLIQTPDSLRVEVSDTGGGAVAPRVAMPEDVTGRGMAIVEALASRWGVLGERAESEDTAAVKTVWFEIAVEGRGEGAGAGSTESL